MTQQDNYERGLIATKVAHRRKFLRLTQGELADAVGCNKDRIVRLELGRTLNIDHVFLKDIAVVLGVPIAYFTDPWMAPKWHDEHPQWDQFLSYAFRFFQEFPDKYEKDRLIAELEAFLTFLESFTRDSDELHAVKDFAQSLFLFLKNLPVT